MDPLVSIIIPVYHVEKFLDKCVASVVSQTYTNLEIILIDDGSPDNCPAICDAWKLRDPRIKVIHQQNGGLSVARNEGLKLATGEFIGFVDSDDWIEPNMYETLLSALLETEADIAISGFEGFTEDSKTIVYSKIKSIEKKVYSAEETLKRLLLLKGFIRNFVWNKLYRRTVLENIVFPKGKLFEDNLWSAQIIGNAKTVVCTNQILYHYFIRPDSLSHKTSLKVKSVSDKLELLEQRIGYIHRNYSTLEKFAVMRFHNFCCREYLEFGSRFRNLDGDGIIRNYLYHHFCQFNPRVIWDKQDIVKGIARIFFWISPNSLLKTYRLCIAIKQPKKIFISI